MHEKIGSVVDFKNKNKANYKDTRITLTEAVLVPFFVVTLNMFQFAETLLEKQISRKFKGHMYIKQSPTQ